MALIDTVMYTVHLLVGTLWTGSVLFLAWGILPSARAGDIRPEPLGAIVGKFTTLSRGSTLVVFVTGGHLAGSLYTVQSLTGTGRGHLVLTMLALWFLMTGLVEVGGSRMREGLDADKVRDPARDGGRFYRAAGVVALLLLVDAGLLAAGVTF